jgi:hypothetical protein
LTITKIEKSQTHGKSVLVVGNINLEIHENT